VSEGVEESASDDAGGEGGEAAAGGVPVAKGGPYSECGDLFEDVALNERTRVVDARDLIGDKGGAGLE
jgi:hypothetical protein